MSGDHGDISKILSSLLQRTVRGPSSLPLATVAPITPGLSLPPRVIREQLRKLTTTLIFLFEVNLYRALLAPPNYYLAVVFSRGTLFISNKTEPVFHLWKYRAILSTGKAVELLYTRYGPTDFVSINLGFGELKVENIESAARCISESSAGRSFFLPATGITRVDTFFLKSMQRTWIESGRFLKGVRDNISNEYNVITDLRCLLSRIQYKESVPASSNFRLSEPERRPGQYFSRVLSLASPAPSPQTASPPTLFPPADRRPTASLNITAPLQVSSPSEAPDIKYPALTGQQALQCTRCRHCQQTFKFTIEYLYHFAIQPLCLKLMTNGATEDLYNRVTDDIVKNLNVNPNKLVCMKAVERNKSCGSKFSTVLQYCLHIDAHRPNSNELFSCYKCSKLYFTPFSFYRHSCLMTLKPISGVITKDVTGGPSYKNLIKPVRDILLTCPQCRLKFQSISGLVNHLNLSNSTCLAVMTDGLSIYSDRLPSLSLTSLLLSNTNIAEEAVFCEICDEKLDNQVSYCLHLDHHTRQGVAALCKNCKTSYSTVCKYFKHSCTFHPNIWCVYCLLVNRRKMASREDKDVPGELDIIKIEDIKLECDGVEENLPKIISVSGGAAEEEFEENNFESEKNIKPFRSIEVCGDDGLESGTLKRKGEVLCKKENKKTKYEFDKWESYFCFDCDPPRILKTSRQIGGHVKTSKHRNIKAAWKYDQVDVKIFNLKKSYKYGVLVREHMADYYSLKKKNSLNLLNKFVKKI